MKTTKCFIRLCTVLYNTMKDRSSHEERKITLLFLFWPLLDEGNESADGPEGSSAHLDSEVVSRSDPALVLHDDNELVSAMRHKMLAISHSIDESSRDVVELWNILDDLNNRVSEVSNNSLVLPEHPTDDDVQLLLNLAGLVEERIRRQNNLKLLLSKEKKYIDSFVFAEKLVMTMENLKSDINNYVRESEQKEKDAVEGISKVEVIRLSNDENTVRDEDQLQSKLEDENQTQDQLEYGY